MNESTFLSAIGWLGAQIQVEPEVQTKDDVSFWIPSDVDPKWPVIPAAAISRTGMFINDDIDEGMWYKLHGYCTVHSIKILNTEEWSAVCGDKNEVLL